MKYKVGDRVKIKPLALAKECMWWNPDGAMDHWAGQTMTIREVWSDNDYLMEEDMYEVRDVNTCLGWIWSENMIDCLASDAFALSQADLDDFLDT